MPIIQPQKFRSPLHQFNGHLQTIIPALYRKVDDVNYERERLTTPDEDFIDLDWSKVGSRKLLIVSHGLEGSSDRHYVMGLVKLFNNNGWDALAWNYRSCSGEINLQPRFYHHADTSDINFMINQILAKPYYQKVFLVGFSLGGSVTAMYMSEKAEELNPRIIGGAITSVPLNLTYCAQELEKITKMVYNKRFYKSIKKKVLEKAKHHPNLPALTEIRQNKIKSLRRFDELFTAPVHGFASADDYYHRASAIHQLHRLARPLLIVNSKNDPFLHPSCFPTELAKKSPVLHLEMPENGGHVGYMIKDDPHTYMEYRALEFAESLC